MPSMLAMRWSRYDLLTKINQMLNRDGSALASAQSAQETVS